MTEAQRKCRADGCERSQWSKGLCNAHYNQVRRGGGLRPLREHTRRGETADEALASCVAGASKDGDCLLWTRACSNGYGVVRFGGRRWFVHRLAYEVAHGTLQPGSVVHHTCGNRACFAAEHLQAVTPHENQAESLRVRHLEDLVAELRQEIERLKEEA